MSLDLRLDEEEQRLVGPVEDRECVLEVRRWSPRILEYKRTFVPVELRGRGVGRRFVGEALDWARRGGQFVIPSCPFVRRYLEDHPEARDLVVERAAQPDPERPGGPNP
jgi:predicted GNAT family acetyltransferase